MAIIDELVALLGYDIQGEADLRKFNKSLDNLEKKAVAVGAAMGRMAGIAGAAVVAGFTFLGKSVLDTSAKFESYAATLETIEGSAAGAETALDWIANFAKTTPYEVDELTAAFVKLRSYGLDPMDGTMETIGDTASAMGKSLDQAVEAWADATTGEFERLKEFGIRAKQTGDQVTFFWTENGREQSKVIKKTSSDIQEFLNDVMGKKFAGAMVRQSKTWNGMMSNLGDSWVDLQRRIGDAGFFDAVKNKLADVLDTVNEWATDGTIDKIASTMSAIFTGMVDAVGFFAERIGTHVSFIVENFDRLEPILKIVGGAFLWMIAKAFPMVAIFTLAGIALDDFLTYLEGGESMIGNFVDWLGTIIPMTDEVKTALAGLALAVGTGLAAAFVLNPMTMLGIGVRLVAAIAAAIAPLLIAGLTGLSTAVVTGFTAAFALLSNPIGWAVILAGVAAALIAFFWDDLQKLWSQIDFSWMGQAIVDGIINGLKAGAAAVAAVAASLISVPEDGALAAALAQANGEVYSSPANPFAGPKVGADRIASDVTTNSNNTTTVNAPVTVNATTNASPQSIGTTVGAAIGNAVQKPARMQGGPAQ